MSSCKKLVLLVAISLTMAVSIASAMDLVAGQRQFGDRLVCTGPVYVRGQNERVVTTERLCPGSYNEITQVYAVDQGLDGKGGFVQITAGGPGHNYVRFFFRSQVDQPINFYLYVYGK